MTNEIPAEYEIVPFPRMRHLVIDVMRVAQRKHMIHGLVEADVTNGRLDGFAWLAEIFGTWERIFYGEFDGRRRKRVLVKIIGE